MERINISKKNIIIGIFAFLILTVFGYLFLPYFYFENAIILGETSLSKKEILELSKIDKDNQKIILITGKSSSTTTVVNFTEYIESCNEIYARILILLKLSMHIIYEK